jgi:geranylgeranyl diphosphate synthase type II
MNHRSFRIELMSISVSSPTTSSIRDAIETALQDAVKFDTDCPTRLREAIEYSLLAPGKRLRPQLVLMACELCGGNYRDALPAAVAVEMIHAYSLVHDDLPAMDNDDLRRGRPTCHKQFDEATAILVGDALQARAFEMLATKLREPASAARCCAELASAVGAEALVGGQASDLASEFQQCSLAELEAIHRRKTGALFRVSLRLGAIIADATDQQLAALDDYADNLGLAFQVVDDLLDVLGNENKMGKRLGKDSAKGKNTYPAILGESASRELTEKLIEQACNALEIFGEKATPLRELAVFVRHRNT